MELVRKPAPMRRRVSAFQGRKSLRERGRERERGLREREGERWSEVVCSSNDAICSFCLTLLVRWYPTCV